MVGVVRMHLEPQVRVPGTVGERRPHDRLGVLRDPHRAHPAEAAEVDGPRHVVAAGSAHNRNDACIGRVCVCEADQMELIEDFVEERRRRRGEARCHLRPKRLEARQRRLKGAVVGHVNPVVVVAVDEHRQVARERPAGNLVHAGEKSSVDDVRRALAHVLVPAHGHAHEGEATRLVVIEVVLLSHRSPGSLSRRLEDVPKIDPQSVNAERRAEQREQRERHGRGGGGRGGGGPRHCERIATRNEAA